ncbi:amino acid adenylation domain-containing protein [Streptomyces sp. NBC_00525]|uniref:amino acid adenylation domain-containing protein n=1 Tax=Streptomyces sp. NBC_00525 TaxID=2903660 RepID=UPI002E80CB62|nr:amino acid adenylation domain-containing protein [Streptomyces sp. NBC_00525]WUC95724.1 amino acid adenylation domain-containing protein [Streptomyces sp. NBC_00525]
MTNRRASRGLSEGTSYWTDWIEGLPEASLLCRDLLATERNDRPTATVTTPVDPEVTARTAALTRGDPTLVMVLSTAVTALLAAVQTDTREVCVLTEADGHAFPVRIVVDPGHSGRQLLSGVRKAYLTGARNLGASPEAMLRRDGIVPTDFAVTAARAQQPAAGATLGFSVADGQLSVTYRTDLFLASTADRLVRGFTRLLAGLLDPTGPDTLGPMLTWVDPAEAELLAAVNRTDHPRTEGVLLHHGLQDGASRFPDRVAVRDGATTYSELNRRANQLARRLRELGAGPGEVIGMAIPRSTDELVALYAIMKAGAAYLPLDTALPAARIRHVLERSRTRIVVGTRCPGAEVLVDPADPALAALDGADLPDLATEDDLAYVIYTSGSTGVPKGVMVEHRAIVNRLAWMQRAYPLAADDVVLHKTPVSFDVSLWEIFWWSMAGCSVSTLPAGAEREPLAIMDRVREHQVTTLHFVPSMLQVMLPRLRGLRTAGLRRIFASGEALSTGTVSLLRESYPDGGPTLINLYGPTEAAVDVTHYDCTSHDMRRPVPLGTPIDNLRLRILTRSGHPAPVGVPGELYLLGTGLARGYLHEPARTAERFVPDARGHGVRAYRTGDAARWLEDGTVEYLGRLDSQVKIRGHRIELGELEHVMRGVAGVTDCAATATDGVLRGFVVTDAPDAEETVRSALAERLPSYAVPAVIHRIAAIPHTPNGKRDLKALAALPRRSNRGTPRGETETALAAVFSGVLGGARIGAEDNLFDLGLDSIKFIGSLAAARSAGLEFTLQDLFAHPSVAALARVVRRGVGTDEAGPAGPFALLGEGAREGLPTDAVDAYPLTYLQRGLLYEIASRDAAVYHDVSTYEYEGPLDWSLFLRAAGEVADRHPALRTSFHPGHRPVPVQVVHRTAPDWCRAVDLSGWTDAEQRAYVAEAVEEELQAGFPDGVPGLVRLRVLDLGGGRRQVLLSYHAAALDGWSVNRLLYDLFAHYGALHATGSPIPGAEPVGFERFVALEQHAVETAGHREFWQGVLDGAESTRVPRLPAADLTGTETLRTHEIGLEAGLGAELMALAGRTRVPVKSVLMAAHLAVLSFVSGRVDVTTGYELSGRPEQQHADTTLGLFLNTLPLRARTDAESWTELIRRVHTAEVELLPHRRFPMGELAREAGRELFEVVFNFTHFHVLDDLDRQHGFRLRRVAVHSQTEFPLRAEFFRDALDGAVGLTLHYDGSAFGAEQIGRIAGYYRSALRLMVDDPGQPPAACSLLDDAEARQLAAFRSGPDYEVPGDTVLDRFAGIVAARPDAVAVQHADAALGYRELDRESRRLAAGLAARGVRHGEPVGVRMARGLPWAVSVLGIMRAGAVYLPLMPGDPQERVDRMVRRAGCRTVLTQAEYEAVLAAGRASEPAAEPAVVADDLAYIIFTSGSTGEPKGAAVTHRGMLNHLQAKVVDLALTDSDVVAQTASQSFDISVWQLLVGWLTGGRSVIVDDVVDPADLWQTVADTGVTVLEVVPSLLDALLEAPDRPAGLGPLRYLMVTGEALQPTLTRRWFAAYQVPVVNAFGPTEASDDITHHIIAAPVDAERVPVGRPILNTTLHVVGEGGTAVPIGTLGEILVSGPAVGAGYVNDPERTAAAFPENTLDDTSPRLYRTGDLGRWLPDGLLDCIGRRDQQVKVRGYRIELPEIEQALNRVPGITNAFVFVHRESAQVRLVARFTGDPALDAAAVRAELARELPAHMLPDVIAPLGEVPLNTNGKVDRPAIAALPLPMTDRHPPRPPATAAEREMVELFAAALGLPADAVGADGDFFDLGGHSLSAMAAAARSGGRFGVRDLLRHRTAEALARVSERADGGLFAEIASSGRPELTVICFPYAGGSPVSYLPLAEVLRESVPVRFLVLDLPPGAETEPRPLLDALVAEVDQVEGPLTVLGHCAGAGPALSFARRLPPERVASVLVVGKTLKSADPADHPVRAVLDAPDETVRGWVVPDTGRPVRSGPTPDEVAALRRDTALGNACLVGLLGSEGVLTRPFTVLAAADDPVVPDFEGTAPNWALLAADPQAVSVPDGGHYLNRTNPRLLASLLMPVTENTDAQPDRA